MKVQFVFGGDLGGLFILRLTPNDVPLSTHSQLFPADVLSDRANLRPTDGTVVLEPLIPTASPSALSTPPSTTGCESASGFCYGSQQEAARFPPLLTAPEHLVPLRSNEHLAVLMPKRLWKPLSGTRSTAQPVSASSSAVTTAANVVASCVMPGPPTPLLSSTPPVDPSYIPRGTFRLLNTRPRLPPSSFLATPLPPPLLGITMTILSPHSRISITESLSAMEIPSAAISSDQTEDKVSNEKRADHGSNESSSKQRSRSYSILGFPTSLIPSSSTSDSCSMFVTAVTPVVQPVVLPSEDGLSVLLGFPLCVPAFVKPVSQADSDLSRASQEQRLHPFPVYFIDLLRARLEDPFTTPTDSDASGTVVYDSSSSPTSTSGASIGGNLMSGQNQMTWMIRLPESTSSMSSNSNCSEAVQSDVIQASAPLSDPSSLVTFSDGNSDSTSSSDVGHEDEQVSSSNEDEATLTFFDKSSPQSPLCFSEEFLLQEGIELLGGDDLDPFAELYKTPSEECLSASSPEDTIELAGGPSSELDQQDVDADG
ncbi:hypothetical protein K435DRAFT_849230 [Dendrothele bispora CBS 962.96]|uniref:Uncharacterized protein n=1 Tax=Dendrothele bispora (strain CBS 962.96) TaxID=1314807 RepID=A0A4S8MSJ3_DENBC|nr:hypothetical protein K435DRAFT_849230 [Dendrothele bispora CBS 962.96]